ncbi:MAG: hypothetical protein IJA34_02995 [Lachnospiraceae bacterium]|nr:hypothetical protein [Lachnospiraceae bacterium]
MEQKKVCQMCKEEYIGNIRFCKKCGIKLKEVYCEIKNSENMFCTNCGYKFEDKYRYCPICGYESEEIQKEGEKLIISEINSSNNYEEIVFCKKKMFSYLVYKTVETNVKMFSRSMKIRQETFRFIGKNQIVEKEIFLAEIQNAEVHIVWDFWDTLYAVIFTILGFFEPVIFLIAIVCAYCGYGKDIEIRLLDGSKFNIPCEGKNAQVDKFLSVCRKNY